MPARENARAILASSLVPETSLVINECVWSPDAINLLSADDFCVTRVSGSDEIEEATKEPLLVSIKFPICSQLTLDRRCNVMRAQERSRMKTQE